MTEKQLTLPVSVISPTDVARLAREVNNLDEFFRQSAIRQGGEPQSLPRYSRLLDELVVANELNLLDSDNRELLAYSLEQLGQSAPVMHISFSADPPGTYIQQIVGWLRQNIHGLILVRVGLMPNIGAGCVVRTTNKTFDFSLRKYFDSKHDYFIKRLHKVIAPEEETAETDSTAVTTNISVDDSNQQIGEPEYTTESNNQSVQEVEKTNSDRDAEAVQGQAEELKPEVST